MTGFKSGASSSPYSSDDDDSDGEDDTATDAGADTDTGADADADTETGISTPDQTPTSTRTPDTAQRRTEDDDRAEADEAESTETASTSSGLPWIYRRSSITDGRAKTVQLHLQASTRERQTDALSDAESELGESVKKADLREAALLVGMDHIDEVADVLREWGYDFE
ncbi:hypothetical protein OB955_23895 [Halobacteria archaeon AArc-m2/3/4]|uniref:Uncharacterized protein n=1 Tax=Natronoglomus mannanivorans TaxID=2979990 RepID=A0ABT2QLC8_9EURY|nr:hypothetical protein [Halobacteria archaeon AArc-m2/3/4]